MKQPDTTTLNPESGKGMAKESTFATFSTSKFSPTFWAAKVFRPKYAENGIRCEVKQWYARLQHAGRREAIGLGTNDREQAARKAARLYQRVKTIGWEAALAEFAPDRAVKKGVPTVGEYIAAASQAADVTPRSLRGYAVCLRRIVADAFGIHGDKTRFDYHRGGRATWAARIDRIRLDKLTPAKVQAALNARVDATRGNPIAEQRARTTAASILRQAKSLFSPELKLPFESVPNPFAGVRVKVGTPHKYASTIDAATLMREGQTELAGSDPEAFKALLLALGAGLRKAEIDCLQWQQIDAARNIIRIQTTANFATKTDSSEGDVFVDPGLIAALEVNRSKATSLFVLESGALPKPGSKIAYYRAAATFDRLTKWLRGKGIMTHKPIHTLRKEFGSIITAEADIHTASRQLRHASIATTAAFYADSRRRVAPGIGAMLAPQAATKG